NYLKKFVKNYKYIGFQATEVYRAIEIIREMRKNKAKIFFGYTSNIISSGIRDIITWLVKNKKVHVLVTTGGGVEEDIIKIFKPFYLKYGSNFENYNDKELREKAINRIYNILVPDSHYIEFEKFIMPFFDYIYENFTKNNKDLSANEFIREIGYWIDKKNFIRKKDSICYWAYKNNIPIFCPTLTDGAIGDMIYFYNAYKKRNIKIDIVKDTEKINEIAINAKKTGIISLGSGVVSHFMLNANLFRNGADYAVYITTASEHDGSAAGASPSEAVSWGKIKGKANYVKIYGDVSIIFPLVFIGAFV
ncbi:MAG: deoxyhypusine synthase, partial [Candidatus Pacearchaeota archaeon]